MPVVNGNIYNWYNCQLTSRRSSLSMVDNPFEKKKFICQQPTLDRKGCACV